MKNLDNINPTVLEINLDNIAHNTRTLKGMVGESELMAVVKADAYGHGAAEVSRVCLRNGASWLGVDKVEEGIELRKNGFVEPILIFNGLQPDQLGTCSDYNLDFTIQDKYFFKNIQKRYSKLCKGLNAHLKIDTGMHRLGVLFDELEYFLNDSKKFPKINIRGIWTHFSEAGAQDKSFTREQIKIFKRSILISESVLGREIRYKHAANSAAILNHKDSYFNLVRPGLGLYGYYDEPQLFDKADLISAIRWVSRIVSLREIEKGEAVGYGRTYIAAKKVKVATIPVGYADGYNRLLSNRGSVLFRGEKAVVIGRVCMGQLMIDLSEHEDILHGEEVVLLGKQGNSEITIYEIMSLLNTIPYEILVNIGIKTKRIYI